jgi:type IV pilus assembly protein PilA
MTEVVLAASGCRTAITETVQSASSQLPADNAWGCESSTAQSKYVAKVETTSAGLITVTSQAMKNKTGGTVEGGKVTLRPLKAAATPLTNTDTGVTIYAWRCGLPGDGTDVDAKYLPGSCRGTE